MNAFMVYISPLHSIYLSMEYKISLNTVLYCPEKPAENTNKGCENI